MIIILTPVCAQSQTNAKKTDHINQSWVGFNGTFFLDRHWQILADAHLRENGFFASNSFVFGRVALGYQLDKQLSVAIGYGNLLSAPTVAGWTTRPDENRIYEQLQYTSSHGNVKILQRIRNEQRWQSIIVNDVKTGDKKFTDRVRYLLNVTIPVSRNKQVPQFVIADECMFQFGKAVVYNTFDQNRIFLGIRQRISEDISFDTGYMDVFQQKNNGNSYTQSNTFRLFMYCTIHPKKKTGNHS